MRIPEKSITFGTSNPRILITGATGYIGSTLSAKLAREGYDLTVCGRDPMKLEFLKTVLNKINGEKINKNKHNFVNLELTDSKQVEKFLEENRNIDGVIHLAGLNSNTQSITHPQETYNTNLFGSFNLINSMLNKGIRKIVFISTGSTYGRIQNTAMIDERLAQHPETPYAKSKVMAERIIEDYKVYDLQSVILRLFNVAGANSKQDLTIGTNVVSLIMNRLKNGTEFVLNGNRHHTPDGTSIRDFLHINDACEAIISSIKYLLTQKNSGLYNVGSGEGTSLGKIIDLSEKVSGQKLNIRVNPTPQYEPPILTVDNTRIRTELGWEPKLDIKNIISDAWEWYLAH